MHKKDVKVGELYTVKVSGKLATVKLTGESPFGGWDGVNTMTGKAVRIKSAQRLRGRAAKSARPEAWGAPRVKSGRVVTNGITREEDLLKALRSASYDDLGPSIQSCLLRHGQLGDVPAGNAAFAVGGELAQRLCGEPLDTLLDAAAKHSYVPTLRSDVNYALVLADVYDYAQAQRGTSYKAHRVETGLEPGGHAREPLVAGGGR